MYSFSQSPVDTENRMVRALIFLGYLMCRLKGCRIRQKSYYGFCVFSESNIPEGEQLAFFNVTSMIKFAILAYRGDKISSKLVGRI